MARIQLVVPDADKDRYVNQAQLEGMSLSQWLRSAAQQRLEGAHRTRTWSPQELERFFSRCDELDGPEVEPDWDEHLRVVDRSRRSGIEGS